MTLSAILSAAVQQQSGEEWAYYRAITVDNTGGSAHTDWPVLVTLSSANFDFANADADGLDLQFRANDGTTVLDFWRESYDSGAETATLWVKVPSVPADDTTTVRLYYGNGAATDTSDAEAVFLFGEDFRTGDTAALNIGGGSIATGQVPHLVNGSHWGEIASHGGTGWRQAQVREQSNIVWTGTEYVILVTGVDASDDSDTGLYYATDIAGTWTEYSSNPVIPLAEDSYITVNTDGSIYTDGSGWHYVFFERKTAGDQGSQDDIGVARTQDFRTDWEVWNGSAWSTSVGTHAAVLVRGTAGAWDDVFTASPVVVHDGTQFVCLYEGDAGSAVYATGVARSADGITWTKEATNPVSTLEVPDDVKLISGTWWMTGHGDAGDQYRLSGTDAPSAWDSTSFTGAPAGYYERGGNSVMLAFGFSGADSWATYQDGIGTNGIRLHNWAGGSKWVGFRNTVTNQPVDAIDRPVGVVGSALRLQVDSSSASQQLFGLASATDVGAAADIAIRSRRRQQNGAGGDNQYSNTVAIGTGAPSLDAASAYGYLPNGYLFAILQPGTIAPVIREYASTFTANLTAPNNVSDVTASAYAIHECRYLSNGSLLYLVNGSSVGTASDTTHVAGNKRVFTSQGNVGTRRGAVTDIEWFVVRPFDGLDPSSTVGSETAT